MYEVHLQNIQHYFSRICKVLSPCIPVKTQIFGSNKTEVVGFTQFVFLHHL
jgi:hypothetical protein